MAAFLRLRARFTLPGVVILVGALLAGSALPVAARNGEQDELPLYSACVGSALESAGFRDISSYSDDTEDAINCLAHYGITIGTARGYFSPRDGISRAQMALFLIRAAGPVGIELPEPSDQGFRDIGRYPRYFRDAINQLAELRITNGKTASTFDPMGLVTRRQMVKFIARFLDLAPAGVGGADIDDVDPDGDVFDDIDDLPLSYYRDIRVLYEMGITHGATDDRFHPDRELTRSQMALFVTRMLAHTNARPAGLTLQAEDEVVTEGYTVEVVASFRDRFHRPVADAPVDLFSAPRREDHFTNSGRCKDESLTPEFGDDLCEIDLDDETTDGDGNLVYDLQVDESLILWAWTGNLREDFDEDRTDYVSLHFITTKPPVAIEVSNDLHPAAKKVRFGQRVDFTFQLVDRDGDPVYEEDVDITVVSEETLEGRVTNRRTRTYGTDSSGRVELTFPLSRFRPVNDDDEGLLEFTVDDAAGYDVIDVNGKPIPNGMVQLAWSDGDDVATTLVLEQSARYRYATTGSRGRNSVTATLVDQYGDPVRGVKIHFISQGPNGLGQDAPDMAKPNHRPTTNRRGQATVRYSWNSNDDGTERISAFTEGLDRQVSTDRDDPLEHYWVDDAPTGRALTSYTVKVHNRDRNTLVIEGTEGTFIVVYDRYDQFNLGNSTERYDRFREDLEEGDTMDLDLQSHDPDDTNIFTRRP
ncbi:MAG: S-layer homology domain-containing protein [bacterium]|nr:S-layer homology domain-containing protein [bacterium]